MQIDEVGWDYSKLIETTNVNVNAVEVQRIWDEGDEALKEAVAIWGILPKGVTEWKKRILEENVANITTSRPFWKMIILVGI